MNQPGVYPQELSGLHAGSYLPVHGVEGLDLDLGSRGNAKGRCNIRVPTIMPFIRLCSERQIAINVNVCLGHVASPVQRLNSSRRPLVSTEVRKTARPAVDGK